MNCPKCSGECWDNTEENLKRIQEGKKERPQYSCKNKEGCGWVMWPDKKGTKTILKEHKTLNPTIEVHENNVKERTMIMSYAKDVVVKKIEVGLNEPDDSAHQIITIYKKLCSELFSPLGKV